MPAKKSNKPAAKAAKPAAKAAKPQAKAAKAPAGSAANGVYVKGLNFPGLSHETVKELFKGSAITNIVLRRKKYCLIYFKDAAGASKAKDLNGKMLKGQKITVEAAKKGQAAERATYCTSVFVGGLPAMSRATGAAAVKKEFAKCGTIQKVRTYRAGHAFVYFADNAAAKKAVTTMDQQSLSKPFPEGKQITVRYSVRSKAGDAAKEASRAKKIAAAKARAAAKKAN
eukprot:TRINITY_DN977_c0_g2_i1.p1 TRINITY_DN977_c0_g2~~TRINITY_DN977_c0_g2_i1.p1  ORF type:complete len:227 (+),score=148.66 TRINITY_DN977_c0_g2_i1:55-735(+)